MTSHKEDSKIFVELTADKFVRLIRSLVLKFNLGNPSSYALHSLRRGSAQHLYEVTFAQLVANQQGGWKSRSRERYFNGVMIQADEYDVMIKNIDSRRESNVIGSFERIDDIKNSEVEEMVEDVDSDED